MFCFVFKKKTWVTNVQAGSLCVNDSCSSNILESLLCPAAATQLQSNPLCSKMCPLCRLKVFGFATDRLRGLF